MLVPVTFRASLRCTYTEFLLVSHSLYRTSDVLKPSAKIISNLNSARLSYMAVTLASDIIPDGSVTVTFPASYVMYVSDRLLSTVLPWWFTYIWANWTLLGPPSSYTRIVLCNVWPVCMFAVCEFCNVTALYDTPSYSSGCCPSPNPIDIDGAVRSPPPPDGWVPDPK